MLPIILLVVVIVVVGVGVLAYRNRTERGIESGISSFRRELRALAPRGEPRPPGVERHDPPSRGVTVVGSHTGADSSADPGAGTGSDAGADGTGPDGTGSDDADREDPGSDDPGSDVEEHPAPDEPRDR